MQQRIHTGEASEAQAPRKNSQMLVPNVQMYLEGKLARLKRQEKAAEKKNKKIKKVLGRWEKLAGVLRRGTDKVKEERDELDRRIEARLG